MEKTNFICICGKEFKSQKSLSAHQAGCKDHYMRKYGNLDVYNERLANLSETQHKYAQTDIFYKRLKEKREMSLVSKQQELDQWISEKHTCEKCGKVMTEYFGSGRFCSRSCANSRQHSEESKNKIKTSVQKHLVNIGVYVMSSADNVEDETYVLKSQRYCVKCGEKVGKNNKSGYCKHCFYTSPAWTEQKKKQSDTMRNKQYPRWNINRQQKSYAEKFFEQVLQNNSIYYVQEYPVLNTISRYYYLDFYIEKNGIKIDLEIDGQQHSQVERHVHDILRDEFLQNNGFIVYRIPWNEISSEAGKDIMKSKILDFLSFYNSF